MLKEAEQYCCLAEEEEEEEEFYKLLPAKKADHLCQLWQSCSDLHKIQTVYDIVENPHSIRLSKNGPHGVGAACEKICIPRPQRSKGSTLENQVPLIPKSTSIAR